MIIILNVILKEMGCFLLIGLFDILRI